MEFKESKKVGDIIEEEVLKRILKKYPQAFIDDKGKKFSDWDIYIPEIKEGIEVKGDYKSKTTHNLVVEVEMNGKLSALSITKAKYWVFVEGYRLIWVTPLEIYRFLEQHIEYGRANFKGNGDNKSKKAHLISHNKFIDYVNNLDKKSGWIEMLKEDDILYYDNFSKFFIDDKEDDMT
jgi:hypothetical protein